MIPGYILLRSDSHTKAHDEEGGGGVALYALYVQLFLLDNGDPWMEHVCVVLTLNGVTLGLSIVQAILH